MRAFLSILFAGAMAMAGYAQPTAIATITSKDGSVTTSPSSGHAASVDLSAQNAVTAAMANGSVAGQLGSGWQTGNLPQNTNGVFMGAAGLLTNWGIFPSFQANYSPTLPLFTSANITNRPGWWITANPGTYLVDQSYGYAYNASNNTHIVSFGFDNTFWTLANDTAWANAANPLTVVQSNSIAEPANWLFGSFCLFQNSIRVLIATNGTYLDELYAPQPEAIASYDPVHFASNALLRNEGASQQTPHRSMPPTVGLISNTIRCWWIYPMNR